jgi:uncharacterized protein (DUF1697 family)
VPAYAALLRAVNLAGRNRVPMGELRERLTALGLDDVATHLQSGNVVFRTTKSAKDVAAAIENEIAAAFDVRSTVILRTAAQLKKAAGANPFLADESDPRKLLVVFLDGAPGAAAGKKLDPDRSPGDRFALKGRELYLHLPNGFGRSKLTIDYLEKTLGVRGTGRNWATVTRLVELTGA